MAGPGRGWLANRRVLGGGIVVSAIAFFFSLNLLVGLTLDLGRLDLTEDGLFTVSDGTREVLRGIDEPVVLRYYRSAGLEALGGAVIRHARRVEELLAIYARLSDGRLVVRRYDPAPFSPEEDLAMADGLRAVAGGEGGTGLYFGIAGHNSTDDREVFPFLAPDRADFLEYDLTRLVHNLALPEKPLIGLLGDLPFEGNRAAGSGPLMMQESIGQFFETRRLPDGLDRIDPAIGILILAQPESLAPQTLWAIDQYAMAGGRILAFVDPLAESMARASGPGGMPQFDAGGQAPVVLAPLLASWGVRIEPERVVVDPDNATRVRALVDGREAIVPYPAWIDIGQDFMAGDEVTLVNLERLTLWSPGAIERLADATTNVVPLLVTGPGGNTVEANDVRFISNPATLMAGIAGEGAERVLIARIAGPAASAFPDGPPDAVDDPELRAGHLSEAIVPLNLVLVADSDFLVDEAWVNVRNVMGQSFALPVANNADFVINVLDNLSGSGALIALRGRGVLARPFEVIRDREEQAEQVYRQTEQELLDRISATEERIGELRRAEEEQGIALTAEQQAALATFYSEMLDLRAGLRDVQFALRRDVEALKARITAINIWAMPAVVALLALFAGAWRRRRAAAPANRSAPVAPVAPPGAGRQEKTPAPPRAGRMAGRQEKPPEGAAG